MNASSTRVRLESVIRRFIHGLGRECPQLDDGSDLHRNTGLNSDEGVLLVIEIGEEFNFDLPDDFNAIVDDSGKRARKFGELVENVDSFLRSEAGK